MTKNTSNRKMMEGSNNLAVAFVNLVPAIIYAFVVAEQLLRGQPFGLRFAAWIGVIIAYMVLTILPYASFLMIIPSAFILAGMLWVLCDFVDASVVRIILKVITAAIVGLIELSIAVNMTAKKY